MKWHFFYAIWDTEWIFGHFKQAGDLKLAKMTEFLKFLCLCHHRKYRTFPTSTTPRGKTRFFEVHMMSHFRKILLEPSSIWWESKLSVDTCANIHSGLNFEGCELNLPNLSKIALYPSVVVRSLEIVTGVCWWLWLSSNRTGV